MVQFLKKLLTRLSVLFPNLSSGLDDVIAQEELIARYIFTGRYFNANNGTVKYGAYLPASDGDTSVYRVSTSNEYEIWNIGEKYVAKPTKRNLRARSDTTAFTITESRLTLVPDTKPHKFHANITNWPETRDARKQCALDIVNKAKLVLKS